MITATIRITRKNEWTNRARKIGIYVDGEKLGTISNGETKEFDVPAGEHSVRAKIDWCECRDLTFSIKDNETRSFILFGNKYSSYLMFASSALLAFYFFSKFFGNREYSSWILIPAILMLVYIFTVGRKDYLVMKEG